MKRFKVLKILQAVFFILTTALLLLGLKDVITAETEQAKGVALVFYLLFFWAIFGGIGYFVSCILGLVGLITAIISYKKTKEPTPKNNIIYFAISLGVIVEVFLVIYAVCLII